MATRNNETELVEMLFESGEPQNMVNQDKLKNTSPSQSQLFPPNFQYVIQYYDMMVILVTLLDSLLKHYIMYVEFSQSPASFVFSLSLLLVSHLYGAWFLMLSVSNTSNSSKICICIWIFISIPLFLLISPFAPFIQYGLRYYNNNSTLSQTLNTLGKYVKPPSYDIEYEKEENFIMNFYRWRKIQRYRHRGFLLQTVISMLLATVQCGILVNWDSSDEYPLYFILYYISIITSTISTALKCIVYQIRNTLFLQSYWFNFFITMYDCIGVLLMLLIFYRVILRNVVTLYFNWITCAPFILSYAWTYVHVSNMRGYKKVLLVLASILALPFWSLLLCAICFSMVMMQIDFLFQTRFKFNEYDVLFWSKMRTFMSESLDKQDAIKRMCSINLEMFHFKKYSKQSDMCFENYLNNAEELDLFESVTSFSVLRVNSIANIQVVSTHPIVSILFPFLNDFWFWAVGKFQECANGWKYIYWIPLFLDCLFAACLMLGSCLYYVSKVLQFCWPIVLLVLCYFINAPVSYGFGVYLLLTLHLVFSIIVLIKFIKEINIYRVFYNILPFRNIPNIDEEKSVTFHERKIYEYYTELIQIPVREQILIDFFGNDIGCIINVYNGRFKQIELHDC